MNLTLIKIGGSIITRKNSKKADLNLAEIKRVCREIKDGMQGNLVILHGAGSYGHVIVKKTGINEGIKNKSQLVSFGMTQVLQNELDSTFCRELLNAGVPAMPVQPSSSAVMNKGILVSLDLEVIKGLLDLGMVPVLYGVPAYDSKQGCSILSADRIITYIAVNLGADRIIHASDVDGVYDKDPKNNSDAILMREVSSIEDISVTGSTSVDVTGGMLGKIKEILDSKVESQIINGLKPGNIRKALNGERNIGTIIVSKK